MWLEDLVIKVVRKGKVFFIFINDMFRIMFYKGLREDFKDILGYLYYNTYDFDRLRVVIRKIELEYKLVVKFSKYVIVKVVICIFISDISVDCFSEM